MDVPSLLRAAHQWVAGVLGLATRRDLETLRIEMETRMDLSEDQLWERAGARAAAIMAEVESLRASDQQKTEALALAAADRAGENERTAQAVAEALSLDTAKDIERLRGHLSALGDEIPATVPDVPSTPAPGEPAEIPSTDSGVPVPPVDESALPSTDPQTGQVSGPDGGTPSPEAPPVVEDPAAGGGAAPTP